MYSNNSDFRGKFKFPGKEKLLKAIESFRLVEKVFFYVFLAVFAGSSLYLMTKANEHFMTEVPAYGGSIKEGVIGYPRYINPLLPITDSGRDLSSLVYSGILKSNGEGQLINDLAENYKVSEDGLTYSVLLKDNIFFHDGEPVVASDIAFTIKKVLDPTLKSPKAASWNGVSVEVIDNKNIQFVLKSPYAPFIENLTLGILPEHIWKDVDSEGFIFSQYNFEPIGSGPFMVKDIKRNSSGLPSYYHLVPFKKYALGKPYLDDLYVYFFTDEKTLVEAYKNGVIDSVSGLSPESTASLSGNQNLLETPLPRIFALFFNQNEASVFLNREVRLALSTAVNRDEIITNVLGGHGGEIAGPLPPQISNIKIEPLTLDERIENATSVLEKAGWEIGEDGVLEKTINKENVSLAFSISTVNSPDMKKTAEILKQTWEKLGARVDIKVYDLADLQQNIIRPRKYETLLFGEVIGRDLDLYAFWHSSERNDPGLNMAMYTNSKVDKLLGDARTEMDYDEKVSILQSIEKNITDDIPAVFLYSPHFLYVIPNKLQGVSLDGITASSDRFSGAYKWFMETDKVWTIFQNN